MGNEDGRKDHRCEGLKVILGNVDGEIMDHARWHAGAYMINNRDGVWNWVLSSATCVSDRHAWPLGTVVWVR